MLPQKPHNRRLRRLCRVNPDVPEQHSLRLRTPAEDEKGAHGRLLRVLTGRYSAGVGESDFAGSAFEASGFTASTGFSGCPLSASRGNVS